MTKYNYLIRPNYMDIDGTLFITHLIHPDFCIDKLIALVSSTEEYSYYPYQIDIATKTAIPLEDKEEVYLVDLLVQLFDIDYSHLPPHLLGETF